MLTYRGLAPFLTGRDSYDGNWYRYDDDAKRSASLSAEHDEDYNTAQARMKYSNHYGYLGGDYRINQPTDADNNEQYNLRFGTGIVYQPQTLALRNTELNDSGVTVIVHSPNNKDRFEVLVNGRKKTVIPANRTTFIPMTAYATYQVSVESVSKSLYHLDSRTKRMTLYQNNIEHLSWSVDKKYVLITQVFTLDHKPVKHAVVEGGIGINQTTAQGFLHTELLGRTQQLIVEPLKGKPCVINTSKIKPVSGFFYQDKMLCMPVKLSKT